MNFCQPDDLQAASVPLVLDKTTRRLRGFDMPALIAGEFALLAYLGTRAPDWQSIPSLCSNVYGRDASARPLVWKYVSMLRKKLAPNAPGLIEVSRRYGYRCLRALVVVEGEPGVA